MRDLYADQKQKKAHSAQFSYRDTTGADRRISYESYLMPSTSWSAKYSYIS